MSNSITRAYTLGRFEGALCALHAALDPVCRWELDILFPLPSRPERSPRELTHRFMKILIKTRPEEYALRTETIRRYLGTLHCAEINLDPAAKPSLTSALDLVSELIGLGCHPNDIQRRGTHRMYLDLFGPRPKQPSAAGIDALKQTASPPAVMATAFQTLGRGLMHLSADSDSVKELVRLAQTTSAPEFVPTDPKPDPPCAPKRPAPELQSPPQKRAKK